ncbi:hypothetical protein PAPYR_9033 [Paratrimastix pyriformis]|uniref:Sushi domain-containing protein n=1 Tax=Paratrimastix pyriformis TaxID=342808 RepID=A0ABQ8U9D5_9EUKA|nr:hypothetical protein PAPYR_9033 [Paratrimastix pyriformis]
MGRCLDLGFPGPVATCFLLIHHLCSWSGTQKRDDGFFLNQNASNDDALTGTLRNFPSNSTLLPTQLHHPTLSSPDSAVHHLIDPSSLFCPAISPSYSQTVQAGCLGGGAIGDSCVIQCALGYAPAGNGTAVCTAMSGGGQAAYIGSTLQCTAVTCPVLTPAPPLRIATGCVPDGPLGSRCRLECEWGYRAAGTAEYRCQGTAIGAAAYVGGDLSCTAVPCPAYHPTATSQAIASGCVEGGPLGSPCTLSCTGATTATGNPEYPCTGTGPGTSNYTGGSLQCTVVEYHVAIRLSKFLLQFGGRVA